MGLFGIRGELPISEPGGSQHVDRTLSRKGKEAGRAATAVKKLAESAGEEGGAGLGSDWAPLRTRAQRRLRASWLLLGHFLPCGHCFPGCSDHKESARDAGDPGSVPGLGRSPAEGKGYRLQFSGLEKPMDRGAWRAAVHGVTKSQRRLSDFHSLYLSRLILF